jgi:cytochrome c biogenesis factor
VLAVALLARYGRHMERSWRWIYVVCAVLALYLNVFAAVVQSFMKIPAVHALAPTQKEPPFLLVQLVVMAIFVVIGICAVKKFHIKPVSTPAAWERSKAS